MNSFTIPNVPPALFERLLIGLASNGGQIRRRLGSYALVYISGVLAEVACDGSALQVVVKDKPFLVPMGLVQQKVREAVEAARAAA